MSGVPLLYCDFNSSCPGGHPIRSSKDHNGNETALHDGMKIIAYQGDGAPDEAGEMLPGFMIYRGTVSIRKDWDITKGPENKWAVSCDLPSWSWVESLAAISPKWIQGKQHKHYRPQAKHGSLFDTYRNRMKGLSLGHVWQGHGSTLFLEFGDLTPQTRRDGSPANPQGQYSIMLEYDWRIEHEASILSDSNENEDKWPVVFERLTGRTLDNLLLLSGDGNLSVMLSGDIEVSSLMLQWTIFDRGENRCIHIKDWWAGAVEEAGNFPNDNSA